QRQMCIRDSNQKKFLIVDDFSDFRSSVRSMLRELGVVEVDTADTGEQALLLSLIHICVCRVVV
ncbi:hypothetical protein QN399_26415, partial [Pseudomonas sp. 10C3]